jgi:hypothetical protein
MHHERLNVLLDKINDPFRIHGKINLVTSGFSIQPSPEWIDGGDIRTRSDGDPLGCIGDLGWYCARIGICVFGYRWPKHLKVIGVMTNRFGIVIDVDVVVSFDDSESEILKFHCSFVHAPRQVMAVLTLLGSNYCSGLRFLEPIDSIFLILSFLDLKTRQSSRLIITILESRTQSLLPPVWS